MKIGFDVAQTCAERAGCGWYADSLVRAMAAVAPENEYILYHHFDWWINASTEAGTTVPGAREPLRGLSAAEAASWWEKIREEKDLPDRPDIVHANCYAAPLLRTSRLVYTVYDISYWRHPEFTTEANRLVCQRGTLSALRDADGFVFISQSSRDEFEAALPGWLEQSGKPWAVTPLGAKEWPNRPPRPGVSLHWLAVGSLEPRKNHAAILDAFEEYWRRSARRLRLRVAGGLGWRSEAVRRRLAEMQAQGMADYLGYVPDEGMPDLYAQAAALIFPSWYEGFGLPVIEAMSLGCPVVTTPNSSLGEIGGTAAIYVEPTATSQITEAMLRLESDPAFAAQHSAAGIAQAMKFRWARTARETLSFYRRLLEAGGAG